MGQRFERYCAQLYRDAGYRGVRHNVLYTIDKMKVQIDLVYRVRLHERFAECKYRTSDEVGLDEVAKFASQLSLLSVPGKRAEMLTNSTYTLRAAAYAQQQGILLYDLEDLTRMEASRASLLTRLTNRVPDVQRLIRRA